MKVSGTYEAGKMYQGNGRWAKVMTTKCIRKVSVCYGVEGEYKARSVESNNHPDDKAWRADRAEADSIARDYIING